MPSSGTFFSVDRADREDLIGEDAEHLRPDLCAFLGGRGNAPLLVELAQPYDLRQLGLLARHPRGFQVLAPYGPAALDGGDRRQFLGRHVGCRQTDVEAGPDRHHRIAGKETPPHVVELHCPGEYLDPEIAPVFGHELGDVGLLGAARHLDDDFGWPPVRKPAHAVAAARQPDLVEKRVRTVGIVLRPGRGVFRLVERRALQHRIGGRVGETEVELLVDLLAMDAEGQGPAEPDVLEERAPDRVVHVEVRQVGDLGAGPVLPEADVVAVLFGRFLEEGVVVEAEITGLQVTVASPGLRRNDVRGADAEEDAVDVRQLLSRGVHAVEIGVADENEAFGRRRRRVHPRFERGQLRVLRPVCPRLHRV